MYADVIVDISTEALDRTFQYRIPKNLEAEIRIGSQVKIPFGRGNRTIRGFVTGVTEISKFPEEKTKEISSVEQADVSVEAQLLQLAGQIRERYGSTMNEALRTVLPIKRKIKSVEEHWLHFAVSEEEAKEFLAQCLKKNYKAKARLIAALLDEETMTQAKAASKYKVTSTVIKGLCKEGIITVNDEKVYRNPLEGKSWEEAKVSELNFEQAEIVDDFCKDYEEGKRQTYLLHGITGSGKTQVYIAMVNYILLSGRQVILLIPEIALTEQTAMRMKERFGEQVSILHSRMSAGERYDQYERAKRGEINVVIGPRSALFLPFRQLGLIIIDEEHEMSYKSETSPKYRAGEVAAMRAALAGASVVLGSATPSVETYYKAEQGEYKKYTLSQRAGGAALPEVKVVDLREEFKAKNYSIFSRQLKELVEEKLGRKEQVMLFLNRRGFAGFVSCRNCGNVLKCPHCDVSLKAHKTNGKVNQLTCHYCGETIAMPERCPECGSPHIAGFGIGTEQLEEMTAKLFPTARILRMDADTTAGKYGHEEVLSQFRRKEADILIGTQMIVKGHDFPSVTLVGVMAADLSMYAGDYLSSERTFQLLMQASGRAGRSVAQGDVVIQTYHPEHYCIRAASQQDYEMFYQNEMVYRKMLKYPPVMQMLVVLFVAKSETVVQEAAGLIAEKLKKNTLKGVSVVGPSQANLYKQNDWYRYVIYVKADTTEHLNEVRERIENQVEKSKMKRSCAVWYDVNPIGSY